jgi:glyoxylase-like metal-dependent hydrolase (beta-lactamase superfamily II)
MVIRTESFISMDIMAATEIVPGVYVVRGKFAGEFGFIASYLIIDEGQAMIIDPGTAGDPGDRMEKALKNFGLDPKNDVVCIACTHGHPDHAGGAGRLKRVTGAPILIHQDDAELLQNPQAFFDKRLVMDRAAKLSMKFDKGPLRVNYRGIEPDGLLSDGQQIMVGNTSLQVVLTRGHSAGHCAFYDKSKKLLFSGDEVNNFPNDPRKFYVDLSGSLIAKASALDRLSMLGADYLLPSHDVPYMFNEARLQFSAVKDGIIHLQDTILTYLGARGDADIEQLVFDIKQSRSVPIPESLDSLLATTIQVALNGLDEAGLVKNLGRGVWTKV